MDKLHTRREIIDYWSMQNDKFLNTPCCPDCRDLLFEVKRHKWMCRNEMCLNETEYHYIQAQ